MDCAVPPFRTTGQSSPFWLCMQLLRQVSLSSQIISDHVSTEVGVFIYPLGLGIEPRA